MLFALASKLLYSIVGLVERMPIKPGVVGNLLEQLPCATATGIFGCFRLPQFNG
jgi:hypothetical protein